MALSLTEYNTSAAAAIAAGSKVEIAGAFFQFASDETPTGWTAITTGTTAYIALTASGTAGSQVVNAGYVSTAPTWRDDLQGWYASAASSVRIVASVYKAESTSYYPKFIMPIAQEGSQRSVNANTITVNSTISSGGLLSPSGIVPINYIHGNTITNGSIFSAIGTYIPTTGQSVFICGSGEFATGSFESFSRAYRTSSTEITLYSVFLNAGVVNATSRVCTSGSATSWDSLSIAW